MIEPYLSLKLKQRLGDYGEGFLHFGFFERLTKSKIEKTELYT